MADWFVAKMKDGKAATIEPEFIVDDNVQDILVKTGTFCAVWIESDNRWSRKLQDARSEVDNFITKEAERTSRQPMLCRNISSGINKRLEEYIEALDNFHGDLDCKIRYLDTPNLREDYCTKRLPYTFSEGDISAWDQIVSTLYNPDERHKIEWGIGAVASGASSRRDFQKMFVLKGAPGTGKSTILNIVDGMFHEYVGTFSAKDLTDRNNSFASDALAGNPLVAINQDGDLSKASEESLLNSIVSHDEIVVNPKYGHKYTTTSHACLWLATNSEIKYNSINSGTVRRILDIHPSGNLLEKDEYMELTERVKHEYGAIAYHCAQVYNKCPNYYSRYISQDSVRVHCDTHDFILENIEYIRMHESSAVKIKDFYNMYKAYCEECNMAAKKRPLFVEEMCNYFKEHTNQTLSWFNWAKVEDKAVNDIPPVKMYKEDLIPDWLRFEEQHSILDDILADCPAQPASVTGTPSKPWGEVHTCLRNIDTHELHYVKPGLTHIVVDADCVDGHGKKDLDICLRVILAEQLPATYAELSKSGNGVHLHYLYEGNPEELAPLIKDHLEVKVYAGNSSLRRKLSKCNNLGITKIPAGYFPKKEVKMIATKDIVDAKHLNNLINKALARKVFPNTKPSMDFIKKITDDAYASGITYDISHRRSDILIFAMQSTHHKDELIKMLDDIHWCSDDVCVESKDEEEKPIAFFDIEVKPNMNLLCWKILDDDYVESWFNPTQEQIGNLIDNYRLIGFNNLRYDNHIVMCMYYGMAPEDIYLQSQGIVNNTVNTMKESKSISYMDLYDLSTEKQSLKKYEIDLKILHMEHETPWDEPCPESEWADLAEYCKNDVRATEAVYKHLLNTDVNARLILANIAGGTPNWTNNELTRKMIFGDNKHPNGQFNYRFIGDTAYIATQDVDDIYTAFDADGRPIFPGYEFKRGDNGKATSTYRGEEVGEGGYVYSEPGVYENVALLDIASMHPSSIIAEQLFGETYTARYEDLLKLRIAIKHKDWDAAKTMLDGAAAGYLDDPGKAKALSKALKIPINSVYGLTAAKFENAFNDKRNRDNIVAKRGALFMVNLKHKVQEKGFTVAHIKTDSIKIPNATPEIIQFVMDYGKRYGYNFEHEATYEKMCLVNDSVYIAKYAPEYVEDGHVWTATGAEFAMPYIFKKFFSKEDICFDDLVIAKSCTTAMYLVTDRINDKKEFMGKCSAFVAVNTGYGYCCGDLVCKRTDKNTGETTFSAATGTKGYLWMPSEVVRHTYDDPMDVIDYNYYDGLAEASYKKICGFLEQSTCGIHTWDEFVS